MAFRAAWKSYRSWGMSKLFQWFKDALPPMRTTEKEAIEAGEVWLEADLFKGRPHWQRLFEIPVPALSIEELAFLNNQVEVLCQMIDDWAICQQDLDLSPETWAYLKKERFFGLIIPKAYGGLEFSALAHSTIVQKIGTRSLTAAVTMMVPNSLGPAELLMAYGTEEQKNHYLPRLAAGLEIPCFALTGPEAGSDASAMPDVGIVCKGHFEGKEILGMRLTWDKRYITLAPVATILGLAFKLHDPEGLLGEKTFLGISLCLLPTHLPGIEIGKRHLPLNQPFMNGPVRGTDVFVPLDYIIGGVPMIGKGWRMLVECLAAGRGISLPALSMAVAKKMYRTTGAYAKIRKQFHTSIGLFEGVEAVMARIGGFTYILEATRLLTLSALDQSIRPSVVTAIAKYHMTEMARTVMNDAMDIHGGKGIMMGPHNYLGRGYEAIPISITVEGANILTRSLIIFGQGAIRCHPFILSEMQAATEPDPKLGLIQFEKAFWGHVKYMACNKMRLLFHALTGGWFCSVPDVKESKLRYYAKQITRMSIALAFVSDAAMVLLGGKLKRKERLSGSLGDVLSYLYMGSAVLKYYVDQQRLALDIDKRIALAYTHWAMSWCLVRIQEALYDCCRFLSRPVLGWILKTMIFPWGRPYILASPEVEHKMVHEMMLASVFRERLTEHTYVGSNKESAVAVLEEAFNLMIKIEPFAKKDKAMLSEAEKEMLEAFEHLRKKTIQVDEFVGADF
jgi:alkylation response protein AidB-like acyl-CoA dehydrogenase